MPSILADVFCILGKLDSLLFSIAADLEKFMFCVSASSGNFIKSVKHDFSLQSMC